ncbi:MAG: hypothetical protein ACOYXT_24555 [Bacteroidota bacterium]
MSRRLQYFFLAGIVLVMPMSCRNSIALVRKEMPLEKYGFERLQYPDEGNEDKDEHRRGEGFEFLMGNGEMGGRLHYNGLGFEKLWFADYWKNPRQREFLTGLWLVNDSLESIKPVQYKSYLDIDKAMCATSVVYNDSTSYRAEIFFSFAIDHLLALKIQNKSVHTIRFKVVLPLERFQVAQVEDKITGKNSEQAYNHIGWTLRSTLAPSQQNGSFYISIPGGESLELFYSVATPFDAESYQQLTNTVVDEALDFTKAYERHYTTWKTIRQNIGSIILPDSDYARWFYRCIYTNYATAGSRHFLAAETQFAYPEVDWDMHAFTYGHGTWAALSFIHLGDSARAKRSLRWLYQPDALKRNVKILIPDTGQLNLSYRGRKFSSTYLNEYPEDALAFGHELTDFGENIPYADDAHWDLQFHLNGFASSVFHRFNKFYPDPAFEKQIVYPVVKGTASFWKGLLKKDDRMQQYVLPPLLSLSENIVEPSVLDAVLAAKWNLDIAGEYSSQYDPEMKFKTLADQIYVPQNDTLYLEYLNDRQNRVGGGYFGIRACAYLGFPLFEQIKTIDPKKARRTLDMAWKRNQSGKGMISFISNWFALTEAYLGNGDEALKKSKNALALQDKTNTILFEAFAYQGDSVRARYNPYFLTGYSSFALVPVSMVLQSYDRKILFFPAMPSGWKNIEFYDLPAEGGYTVSGRFSSTNNYDIMIKRKNKHIKTLHNQRFIRLEDLPAND